MNKDLPLSAKAVKEIMDTLNEEQKNFFEITFKQSKKSKWIEILAKNKGIAIDKSMSLDEINEVIDDWILIDILDRGYGLRPYKCECGKSLRFQYIVHHKKEKKDIQIR